MIYARQIKHADANMMRIAARAVRPRPRERCGWRLRHVKSYTLPSLTAY